MNVLQIECSNLFIFWMMNASCLPLPSLSPWDQKSLEDLLRIGNVGCPGGMQLSQAWEVDDILSSSPDIQVSARVLRMLQKMYTGIIFTNPWEFFPFESFGTPSSRVQLNLSLNSDRCLSLQETLLCLIPRSKQPALICDVVSLG